jgi:hypothetical protein
MSKFINKIKHGVKMSKFSYLIEKINKTELSIEPFSHIYIENFFTDADFESIIKSPEIATPSVSSDQELIDELQDRGYKIINFPGCITSSSEYIRWHSTKNKNTKTHSACEGFGMVMRLFEKKTPILKELNEFLLSEEFNRAIAERFNIVLSGCKIDGGIQKYLDGYEISPHPDIRKKAATYMVNINPSDTSVVADHHTHYLKFKASKEYVSKFWESNTEYDRDWVPWDWCKTIKQQNKNNSIVIFSPSNDTIHAVKADYDHLITQRTQLYGNIWHLTSETKPLNWEQLQIPKIVSPSQKNWKQRLSSQVPPNIKSIIKKNLLGYKDKIGKTNMN